jgi:hypothetical protein
MSVIKRKTVIMTMMVVKVTVTFHEEKYRSYISSHNIKTLNITTHTHTYTPAAAAAAALFLLAAVSFGTPSRPLLPPGIGAPDGPLPWGIIAGPLVPGAGTCNCCCLR